MILQSMLQHCFYLNASLNHWKQVKAPQAVIYSLCSLWLRTQGKLIWPCTCFNIALRRSANFYSSYNLFPFQHFSHSVLWQLALNSCLHSPVLLIADEQHPPKLQSCFRHCRRDLKAPTVHRLLNPPAVYFFMSFPKTLGVGDMTKTTKKKPPRTQEERNSWKLCCL